MKSKVLNPLKKTYKRKKTSATKRKETIAERKARMKRVRSFKRNSSTPVKKSRKKVSKKNPGLKVSIENKRFVLRLLNAIYEESHGNSKVEIQLTEPERKKLNSFIHYNI